MSILPAAPAVSNGRRPGTRRKPPVPPSPIAPVPQPDAPADPLARLLAVAGYELVPVLADLVREWADRLEHADVYDARLVARLVAALAALRGESEVPL